jgi:hypothetical protein
VTVRAALGDRGFVQVGSMPDLAREATVAPFEAAARVLGETPLFVERQTIRPIDGGRSIASTSGESPLHTDSQMILGVPATAQILLCIRAAKRGGESTFVDAFDVLGRLEREDPRAFAAAFDEPITQSFYFGDVHGPIVALRGGHLTVTLATNVRTPFHAAIVRAPRETIALRDGNVLVASNHRMAHGRTAFDASEGRELLRLLVWLDRPLAAPPAFVTRARSVANIEPDALVRMRAVASLLRGVPPAKIARELGITEAALYALRDRALGALS